jgi:formate dehydrogenase iron-sulfur subunit
MGVGLLFDSTLCIGCGACAAACKEENKLPGDVESRLTAYTWTVVAGQEGSYVRRLCMHCLDPTCVSVCPIGALQRSPEGAVVYDAARCIGCRYCMMACPFDVPKYQWDSVVPIVGKCVLCHDRLASGRPPACAEACPTGATLFGERPALLTEAATRMSAEPGRYVPHVYGTDEAGGTAVLLLSGVPFEQLGYKMNVPPRPLPMLTWEVLSKVPDFVGVAAACLFGVHWITHRREEVQAALEAAVVAPPVPVPRPGSLDRLWSRLLRVVV